MSIFWDESLDMNLVSKLQTFQLSIHLINFLGPFVNFLGEKYTYRKVMMIGSCLVLLGYTTSAFVRGIKMLYLSHGVITGKMIWK